MNLLLDTLPETITVNGIEYFADTDFRTMIILEKVIGDNGLGSKDKIERVLDLVLTEEQPAEIDLAIKGILDIYSCGTAAQSSQRRQKNGNVDLKPKLIYSYDHDAPYIYGAFLAQYGIDLNDIEYLHWWKFQALFRSLPSSCKIVEIMGYRAADLSKIKNKEERSRIARLQQVYAIPQNYTFEDKVAMAGMAFGGH